MIVIQNTEPSVPILDVSTPVEIVSPEQILNTVVPPITSSTSGDTNSLIPDTLKEIIMADIVTGTVTGLVDMSQVLHGQSDIRRETAEESSDARREVAKEASDTRVDVNRGAWGVSSDVANSADRIVAQDTAYFIAGQSQNFSNATALAALTSSTNANFNATLAAIQLAASQTTAASTLAGQVASAASALAAAQTQHMIVDDGNTTRALINSQTIDELRFRNIKGECCDKNHRGEKSEGTLTYGPAVSATYPV
jgi:hypothetical protein